MRNLRFIVEKHPGCYVAYSVGLRGSVVGQGSTYQAALADAKSAASFHIETFGADAFAEDDVESPDEFLRDYQAQ